LSPARPHSDDRQRVLDATDIVQLVGEHVSLKPKGREYVGLCPFHDDHRPSMTVVPHKRIYHCFSCGAGGDAIAFVMNYHKMGFREALEHLARRANIELTPWRGGESRRDQGGVTRDAILSANLTAADFFRTILQHPEHGRAARELISRRGISPDMVQLFGLGAAPDRWDGLLQVIQKKRLPVEPFVAAGLLKTRASGGQYDAFRNRLIFPITDQIGRVIAFGGRRLNDEKREDGTEEAKYLNSAESIAFDKSATLFGLHQAAPEIRRKRTAIVTEGYMDAIACHQAGITNVVATLGTALTAANARILRRQCETVILLFDGDEAGQRAAERAVEVFFAEPIDVKIAMLSSVTDAKDPDELLKREDGLDVFGRVIEAAVDPLTLLMDRIKAEMIGRGIAGRARVLDEFIARLVALGLGRVDPIRKQLILTRLTAVAGVDWETIVKAVGQRTSAARPRPAAPAAEAPAPAAGTTVSADAPPSSQGLRERLLGCILCDPALLYSLGPEEADLLNPDGYAWPPYRVVARAVGELDEAGEQPTLSAVLGVLEDPEAQRAATALASEVDRLAERVPERVHALWNEWLAQVRRRRAYEAAHAAGGSSDWDALAARIEALRELATTVGLDPAAMPPVGGVTGSPRM
jgi:DNA primase